MRIIKGTEDSCRKYAYAFDLASTWDTLRRERPAETEAFGLGWKLTIRRGPYFGVELCLDCTTSGLGSLSINGSWDTQDPFAKEAEFKEGSITLMSGNIAILAESKTLSLTIIHTKHPSSSSAIRLNMKPSLPDERLWRALLMDSICDDSFIDTKFYCYSRRAYGGVIDRPLPLFANSRLCSAASEYLRTMLCNTDFQESQLRDFSEGFPEDEDSIATEYDYESDSDLESESGEDGLYTVSTDPNAPRGAGRIGKVICIKDTAFTTWQAYLFYLYTGQVTFKPLKSQPCADALDEDQDAEDEATVKCSPKSMYRLADKLGDQSLQMRALETIRASLSPDNIIDELFSNFTSQYPEVQNMQVDVLRGCYSSVKVAAAFRKKMMLFAQGELEHAVDIVMAVLHSGVTCKPSSGNKPT